MATNFTAVGIQSASEALMDTLDYEAKTEQALVRNYLGAFGAGESYNPIIEWSMSGAGDTIATAVIAGVDVLAVAITGVTDGVGLNVITNVNLSESNTDFEKWSISGTYYPSA